MSLATVLPLSIPSPGDGVWHIGPLPIRGYALCIVLGIVVAVWLSERRWAARGGKPGEIADLALWAVPLGIIGARLYHVATDHDLYFGAGRSAWNILYVWHGGLGIWGGVAGGALGVWIGAKQKGIRFLPLIDIVAPTLLVAQAIGRWGNWFNQELYGKPTDLPWGLKIDEAHRVPGYENVATFHPTFLYECVWNLAAFALLLWLERRFRLGYGKVMALYVMFYCAGRGWIEMLRIDTVELNHVLGLRFNVWTSIVLFVVATAYLLWSIRKHPGREDGVYVADNARAEP
ncbi:prolipoprotein diacylglyceryl transferase [Nocardioides sp. Kera G14]|uniref:prolipoprotein diacylglyceryl transferase n=1 Tax=Nocardioides sp. Kera G14 TaxID=2884264 RepID=UPI001D0FA00B|nr:prolipoprotein diacylglyceryl transferase [Nocardioides sp. Kera G14]UDY22441.1 prolipoprotein diacylglyceryl transferase [Nocardioides sp. Kera G14]